MKNSEYYVLCYEVEEVVNYFFVKIVFVYCELIEEDCVGDF